MSIRGFIDIGTGPPDEIVVELANNDERTVDCEPLVPLPDFHGNGVTREIRFANVRLDPAESPAMPRHFPNGFNRDCGSCDPAQRALAIPLQVPGRETALAHHQTFKWDVIARLPDGDFTLPVATVRDWRASRTDV